MVIKTLGEICTITSSKRIFRSEYQATGVPFYRGREIIERQKGKTKLTAELFIARDKFDEIKSKFGAPTEGDLLLTSVGTIGVPYVVRQDDNFYFKDGNLTWFKDFKNTNSTYLYYWLLSAPGKAQLKKATIGTSQSAYTIVLLKRLQIDLPELAQQDAISNTLKIYDDLIENNSKRIEKLEAMARLLYRSYFETPEAVDWRKVALREVLTVYRGKSYKGSELSQTTGLPFVNLKCVNRGGGFRKDGLKLFTGSFKSEQEVRKGDIVMAVTDMTQDRAIVGRAARVPSLDGGYGVISMDMVKIEKKGDNSSDYLYSMLRWSGFANEIKNHANGANVLHLLPARITNYMTSIPPTGLQNEFVKKVMPLFDLIDNLQQKNELLAKARDLLLPRLMSGELEV
jgi:type I restriction enzyme S subunit